VGSVPSFDHEFRSAAFDSFSTTNTPDFPTKEWTILGETCKRASDITTENLLPVQRRIFSQ
jgi:hypothetical protein